MAKSIKDLIDELIHAKDVIPTLPNSIDTWSRIGSGDTFTEEELGDQSISKWIEDNPYDNI